VRRLVRTLLLLVFAAAATAGAAPLRVEQVAPGVYVHFGQHKDFEDGYDGDIANIGFVIGSEAVAVIDTGGSWGVGMALKEALRALTRLPVRYVINTHAHPDHVFGNAAFLDAAAPPRFIGHARLPGMLAVRGEAYLRNLTSQLPNQAGKSRLIAPTDIVEDQLTLDLGNRKLLLKAWPPAHTNNDLSVFDAASGTLWTGDLLFIERTPSVDGDVPGWLSAMDELDKTPARIAIPGHGPPTLDKHQALARQRSYLHALLRDVRAAVRRREDMGATMATAAASERPRWRLFDAVNRRNVNLLYPALEWE
jgi:quinoprotein relay system zinc metallohydrolase 2